MKSKQKKKNEFRLLLKFFFNNEQYGWDFEDTNGIAQKMYDLTFDHKLVRNRWKK